MTPGDGLAKGLGEERHYKVRVLMPDPERLTPELLSSCAGKGYVLEVEVNAMAVFIGAVNVPTLLDILGGGVGGPVAFAFLEDNRLQSQLAGRHKRWYISTLPGVDWGLPKGIRPDPVGGSAVAGDLHAHFELVPRDRQAEEYMGDYFKMLEEAGIIVMPSKDYVTPTSVLEALRVGRSNAKG